MRLFIISLALVLCLTAKAGIHVDLDKSNHYSVLFDAGLRPIHHYGLEMSDLELIEPEEISFIFAGRPIPAFKADWGFSILHDYSLSTIMGYSRRPMTKDETFVELSKWDTAWGFEADLPNLKKWLDAFPDPKAEADLWGRRIRKGKAPITSYAQYYLRHSMNFEKPFLMTLQISWHDDRPKDKLFGDTPIPSPPGYEAHDIRSAEIKNYEKEVRAIEAAKKAALENPAPRPTPPKTPEQPGGSSSWWKWLLVFLALGLAARRAWHLHRSKQ